MRNFWTILILCLCLTGFTGFEEALFNKSTEFRQVENRAFKAGEKTSYLVHYGIIDAGIATIEITEYERQLFGRDIIRIHGQGKSRGMVNFFFPVDDTYETYLDKEGLFPWLFIRNVSEGGYEIHQTYKFFQNEQVVETEKGEKHQVPSGVQDMFSAAFYCRTLDLSEIQIGDVISVESFVDGEIFNLSIRYAGKDEVEIRSGKFKCLKFNPVIQTGRLFKDENDLAVWITDDENKLPILCSAGILVGSIKVELVDWEGLANPLAIVEK